MAAAGGSQEQADDVITLPQSSGSGTVSSPHSGETRAGGHGPAQQFIEAVKKSQEEIPDMEMAELLAYQERLRALRLLVLQRIKEEEEEKAAAAEQATTPEPRRAGC